MHAVHVIDCYQSVPSNLGFNIFVEASNIFPFLGKNILAIITSTVSYTVLK